jgi:hypothetical protein
VPRHCRRHRHQTAFPTTCFDDHLHHLLLQKLVVSSFAPSGEPGREQRAVEVVRTASSSRLLIRIVAKAEAEMAMVLERLRLEEEIESDLMKR